MNHKIFYELVKPFSMTSKERIDCLYNSLEYVRTNNIEGDIVECGVWKGGNILGIMEYLEYHKIYDKNIWLYDTFQGMTKPEDIDIDLNNQKASEILEQVMCYSSLNDVKSNLSVSKFPMSNVKFVEGDVCQTLNYSHNTPKEISLLRLDTDWHESTKKELEILHPKLTKGGVLIIDDYGHWMGTKKAVDEFFENRKINIEKIDYTGIKIIKQ